MTDWIANAEAGSSVRAKLNLLERPIGDPTVVSSPVEYIDISVPSGYDEFRLTMRNVSLSGSDVMAIVPSVDAGATFLNTPNSYKDEILYWLAGGGGLSVTQDDQLFDLGWFSSTDFQVINVDLHPGSLTDVAFTRATTIELTQSTIASSMLVTPAGRVNLIRVLPYGNADADPPTSGTTITAGTFRLFGVPTP